MSSTTAETGPPDGQERPLFSIEPVQLQFSLQNQLQRVKVALDHMFLFAPHHATLIDLTKPSQVKKIGLPPGESFSDAFVDPLGFHLIVQTTSGACFYHNSAYSQFKPLHKFKGIKKISAIVFSRQVAQNTTDDFLVVAETGVFVASIKAHPLEPNKKDDKHVKLVWRPPSPVFAAVYSKNDTRLHLFSAFTHYLWDTFDTLAAELARVFKTAPVESSLPDQMWLFDAAIEEFAIVGAREPHHVVSNDVQLDLSAIKELDSTHQFEGMVLLAHHILALTHNQVLFFNKLNARLVHALDVPTLGVRICADHARGTYWLYTSDALYEVVLTNEEVLVWHDYYKLGKYAEALACLADEPENHYKRDMVKIRQGYDYLQQGGFGIDGEDDAQAALQLKGIRTLAALSELFEKVCLMLLPYGQTKALLMSLTLLIEYLVARFTQARAARHHVQIVVLSLWIVERMLTAVYHATEEQKPALVNQFRLFLQKNYKHFDRATIYQIISRLNFHDLLVYYAELIEDYEYIIHYHLHAGEWAAALATLGRIFFSDHDNAIIYETLTLLLTNYPQGTVELWLKLQGEKFDPIKILPAILTYHKTAKNAPLAENKALFYLLKLIFDKQVRLPQINNYYLALLVTYPLDHTLAAKHVAKFLHHGGPFDCQSALRLCVAHNHHQAAVQILLDLGLYGQALEVLVRQHMPRLGEQVLRRYDQAAEDPSDDALALLGPSFATRKRLWLDYSTYLIAGVNLETTVEFVGLDRDQDMSKKLNQVLRFILELDGQMKHLGTITLKDLLPLLPDTIIINDFRDEIVSLLNAYNTSISQLALEMKELLLITAKLKRQIAEMATPDARAHRVSVIQPGEECRLCQKLLLLTKNVCYFPNCHHGFHKDCVVRAYLKLGNYQFKKVFAAFKLQQEPVNKSEMEAMLIKECFLCSEHNIATLDAPLANNSNDEWTL